MSRNAKPSFARLAQDWARAFALRLPLASEAEVVAELSILHQLGLTARPLSDSGNFHHELLEGLSWIGFGSLPLGRLLEGHLNALLLIEQFGTSGQNTDAKEKASSGVLFGVWNTGAAPVRIEQSSNDSLTIIGGKTFASGASFVRRPIVTGDFKNDDAQGWQMALIPMEDAVIQINRETWKPLGMEASYSFDVDFTGTTLRATDLIGMPGDIYREPAFSGGAIRFAAVHAGGARRLVEDFTTWLRRSDRGSDPHQAMRLSVCVQQMQEILLWIRYAGDMAEEYFATQDANAAARMVQTADMVRTAVERNATEIMRLVSVGVGARGLLDPHPFGHTIRDLTMYLRQPAPDRIATRIAEYHLRHDTFAESLRPQPARRTLTQRYFDDVYSANRDPWQFETSPYEAEKYASSIAILPRERYGSALEIGCSIGVFTRMLAQRCDQLTAIDIAEKALAEARHRNRDLPHVRFDQIEVPRNFPDCLFDLITISEVAYYWSQEDLRLSCRIIADHQTEGSDLLLVHWTPHVEDYPLGGDQVHDLWLSMPWWQPIATHRHATYRMDVLRRNDLQVV